MDMKVKDIEGSKRNVVINDYNTIGEQKEEAGLSVMVIDDYRNKIIADNRVCIMIDGKRMNFSEKNDGCCHVNMKSGLHDLTVGGNMFQRQDMVIDPDEEKEIGKGILKIRLQPDHHYLSGKGVTVLSGWTEPRSEVHFVFIHLNEPYRLYWDYKAGDKEILIFHQSEMFLDGTQFCLQKADGRVEEFWIEAGMMEAGRYELRYPLRDSYESEKCILRRVYAVTSDDEGRFYLPVPAGEEQCEEYRYYNPMDKQEVRTGKLNGEQYVELVSEKG